MTTKTLIIGAGIIGLLTAYKLAKEGIEVILLEKNSAVGREASWAGGGIISPLFPWRQHAAITSLVNVSQDSYLEFIAELKSLSNIDPEYYITGLYWLNLEDEQQALDWAQQYQRPLNKVDIVEVERAVSVLGSGFTSAVYMDNIANIRNPRLVKALHSILVNMPNVQIKENCLFIDIIQQGGRVVGVHTSQQDYYGDNVVICTGAWTGSWLDTLGINLSIQPVKGQMILFKCKEDFLPTIILANERYAIPRRDGHILVGSTIEYVGYDNEPTLEAQESLRQSAVEMLPELAKAQVIQHWSGIRPAAPEGIPYIGEVPNYSGLWLNCGHFLNGFVLAPASCQLLTELMLGRQPVVDANPYMPINRV
ncbi:glycine oxidase ThiO [Entomomonas asaccharolytica]|uniref:Glycine oxidase ThiO n=1 Tax=Entomomonas asaccharolytica TaxID=2785331 RepID=A0A974NHL5_9GAMM|nr:glycine oxidase ThiO [Entomomonas asaccharolytica]QQP86708.1 glycine oxidase ThiO [Entomomonas asaccharolytica]